MARFARLIAGLVVAVLLAHWAVLAWLALQWHSETPTPPLAPVVYTRLLRPDAQPAAPTARPAPPPPRMRRPGAMEGVATAATPPASAPTAGDAPATEPPAPRPDAAASGPDAAATASASAPLPAPLPEAAASTAGPAAPLDAWPTDTRLSYQVSGNFRGELHGEARVQWRREQQRYQVRVEVDLGWLAKLELVSEGEITPQGLFPRRYDEQRPGGRRKATLDDSGVVLDSGARVPRPEGVQDTASQFVELTHRFLSGQSTLDEGQVIAFWMARPGGVDRWTYDVGPRVRLATPQLGAVEALALTPRPIANPRGNITAQIWIAPSLQYLPARIRINLGEGYIDLLVSQIEQR